MGRANRMGKWNFQGVLIYPSGQDPFNEDVILDHYIDWKADLHIILKDAWCVQQAHKLAINNVFYTPIDHSPVSPMITSRLHTAFKILVPSRHAQRELKQAGFSDNVYYIPHGCDTQTFRILENRTECKRLWFVKDPDDFTVLIVARNQSRKQIPRMLRAYKRFLEMNRDTKSHLLLWTDVQPLGREAYEGAVSLGVADVGVNLLPEIMELGLGEVVLWPDARLVREGLPDWAGPEGHDMVKLYNCLPPDEFIFTKDGLKKISEIQVGEEVLTHRGRYRKVLKVFRREYRGSLLEIRVGQLGSVRLTPEHPILALKPKFRPQRIKAVCSRCGFIKWIFPYTKQVLCGNCRSNKMIVTDEKRVKGVWQEFLRHYRYRKQIKRKQNYTLTWVRAGELMKDDVLLFPRNNDVVDRKTTVDNLIFYGFFAGDGFASKSGRIGVCSDLKNAEYISGLFQKVIGHKPHVDKSRTDYVGLYKDSKTLASKYHSMFGESAKNKHLPLWCLQLPPEKQQYLLRGLWLADGHKRKDGLNIFVTISDKLAGQIIFLLLRQGIVPSISHLPPQGKGKQPIWRIAYKYNDKQKRYYVDSQYVYLPVRAIREVPYDGEVFNLKVEEDNSYVTKSFIVHNCADVLLGTTGGEGFFLPGLEAQACGVPIVVTDYASAPEICGVGLTVPPSDYVILNSPGTRYALADIDKTAEALTKIANADREKLARKARAFAERYDWSRIMSDYWQPFLRECEIELFPKITKETVSTWD
jgi:glycosyltransferase involved in cell wall biosynthesis